MEFVGTVFLHGNFFYGTQNLMLGWLLNNIEKDRIRLN